MKQTFIDHPKHFEREVTQVRWELLSLEELALRLLRQGFGLEFCYLLFDVIQLEKSDVVAVLVCCIAPEVTPFV